MKKQHIILPVLTIFFLTIQNSFAQSFVTTSENVTVNIVRKISIIVNPKNEESNYRTSFKEKIKSPKRNLLVSYNRIFDNSKNSPMLLSLRTHSLKSTLSSGEQAELKNLSENEKLYISVENKSSTLFNKHFVTIVY